MNSLNGNNSSNACQSNNNLSGKIGGGYAADSISGSSGVAKRGGQVDKKKIQKKKNISTTDNLPIITKKLLIQSFFAFCIVGIYPIIKYILII